MSTIGFCLLLAWSSPVMCREPGISRWSGGHADLTVTSEVLRVGPAYLYTYRISCKRGDPYLLGSTLFDALAMGPHLLPMSKGNVYVVRRWSYEPPALGAFYSQAYTKPDRDFRDGFYKQFVQRQGTVIAVGGTDWHYGTMGATTPAWAPRSMARKAERKRDE